MHACEIRAGVTQTLTMRIELLCGRRAVVVFGQLLPNESSVRVIGDGAEGKTRHSVRIRDSASPCLLACNCCLHSANALGPRQANENVVIVYSYGVSE